MSEVQRFYEQLYQERDDFLPPVLEKKVKDDLVKVRPEDYEGLYRPLSEKETLLALNSIPLYHCEMGQNIPEKIVKLFERISKIFLWGKSKRAKIPLAILQVPKSCGGLVLRSILEEPLVSIFLAGIFG